tara:strand:+ start:816 stop:1274 length:459 start_codon:yes stop_codon:yes gene_type:complete
MSEENTTPEAVEETTAAPAEEPKEEAKKEVEVPKEFKTIIDAVEKMSVLELNALVKVIEEKWGVSATAVAAAGPAAGADAGEKSEFEVVLASDGGAKIPVMKAVKELLGLGLKEAKDLVESAPVTLKESAKADEANDIKAKIEEAGGKVELK